MNQYDKLGVKSVLLILLFQGIIGFALHYSIWYEAIKRLNLSKATTLVSVYPTFSIALAWFILKEVPNFFQLSGFGIIIMVTTKKSEQNNNLGARCMVPTRT
jgi:drug/metabolite transporter (DMT)-like permease